MARSWDVRKFGDPQIPIDYKGLASPFTIPIKLQITNTETVTLYFKASVPNPPAGYTANSQNLGSVAAAGSGTFEYAGLSRTVPASDVDDTITLRLTAYTDAGYTTQYGSPADLTVTVELFNRDNLTLVDSDNFDQGNSEGWSDGGYGTIWDLRYLSAPYSYGIETFQVGSAPSTATTSKSFTIGAVSRAYIIIHTFIGRSGGGVTAVHVTIGGVKKLPPAGTPPQDAWYRLCFRLPVNATTQVSISFDRTTSAPESHLIDEIYVVTKA